MDHCQENSSVVGPRSLPKAVESRAVNSNLGDSKSETEVYERTRTRKLTAKCTFLVIENLRNGTEIQLEQRFEIK